MDVVLALDSSTLLPRPVPETDQTDSADVWLAIKELGRRTAHAIEDAYGEEARRNGGDGIRYAAYHFGYKDLRSPGGK